MEASILSLGKGIEDHEDDMNEEKPDNEATDEKIISFKYGDKTLKSGDEITINKLEKTNDGSIEMVTPVLSISGPTKSAYTVVAEKMSHKDNNKVGLTSFCLSSCLLSKTDFDEEFRVDNYTINPTDMVSIHYGIAKSEASKSNKYTVRLVFLQGKKEVAYLNVVFDYKADSESNGNTDDKTPKLPDPEPQPIPDPTPGTGTELTEAPEKLKSTVVAVEFTGQKCPACDKAINRLKEAQEAFKSDLIVVAMHSYRFTEDLSFYTSYSSPYQRFVSLRYLPSVYLNLDKNKQSYYQYSIENEIKIKPLMKSTLEAEVIGNGINIRFRSDQNDGIDISTNHSKYNVLLWITENNIIGYQSQIGWNYNHQHVFRGYLNGEWGEPYTPGKTYSKTAEIPYDHMKIENCEVIAIVTDSVTHEFIDAVKVHLKK